MHHRCAAWFLLLFVLYCNGVLLPVVSAANIYYNQTNLIVGVVWPYSLAPLDETFVSAHNTLFIYVAISRLLHPTRRFLTLYLSLLFFFVLLVMFVDSPLLCCSRCEFHLWRQPLFTLR